MIKKIAIVVAVLLLGVLVAAAMKPDTFRVERTITIGAPADSVFPLFSNFHRWSAWSPWEKLDPGMKRTYSGPAGGVGAVYAWEGNRKVGAGRMEITEATPPSKVETKLDFLKPFEAHNTAEFLLMPKGDSTRVTWAMYGPNTYLSKIMDLFFSMDRMIGKDFEAGLTNVKNVAEGRTS